MDSTSIAGGYAPLVLRLDPSTALIVNMPDRAYDYENPDHWRLPPATTKIPYSFKGPSVAGTAI